jgi:heme/copper-type cytochrome/quinol oxidase subunit 3
VSAYAVGAERVRPAAWWGMVVLVAAEATLFGCFVGTYFFLRFTTPVWPPDGIRRPDVAAPIVLALVLASAAAPMTLALRAARAARLATARLLVVLALVVQAGYFGYEVHEYSRQLHAFTPQTDAYGSIYFTMLGADHAHVAVGLLLDLWLLLKLARGFTRYRVNALWAITVYWYAVSAITLAVTATLVSARI